VISGKRISMVEFAREKWGEESTSKSLPTEKRGFILLTLPLISLPQASA
jgi:hypothetical protein